MATIRWPLISRRVHKWLALFVGAQAVIWTLSGLYMTVIHIDVIHGDHFIRMAQPRPLPAVTIIDPAAAAATVPGAEAVKLHWFGNRPTYIVSAGAKQTLVDARRGSVVSPPSEEQIRQLAT